KRVARAARQRALRSGRGEHGEVRHDRVAAGGGVTPRRGIARRRVDLGDGSSCEREQGGRAEETAGHAPARFRMNSLKSRTPMPVGPFAWWGTSPGEGPQDRKSTRLNSSHGSISYAVFCLKKKKEK